MERRRAGARGPRLPASGCVVFLGHLGNWDTAGAWSSGHLAPVTTVVERLEPEEVFRDFLEFRESLGMTIIPLTGGGDPFLALKQAIGRGERSSRSSPTATSPTTASRSTSAVTGPGWPRVRRCSSVMTKAPLFTATVWYEDAPALPVGQAGRHPDDAGADSRARAPTRDKVQVMVQACADLLGDAITRHTEDWHMLQRIFVDDLDDRGPDDPPSRRRPPRR